MKNLAWTHLSKFSLYFTPIDNMFEKGCDIEWYSLSLSLYV